MDLYTDYLGLSLANPLIAAASPLSQTLDGIRRLANSGVAAIVLFSLFEEELQREAAHREHLATAGIDSFAEALSYLPANAEHTPGARHYLSLLERAANTAGIPVIGSLNGCTPGGWVEYAHAMQEAGAAAIELNIYYVPGDPHIAGHDVEQRHIDILTAVKAQVTIPVAVKLGPYHSNTGNLALRLDEAGADGLVLFNRFLQPDIDTDTLAVLPTMDLSHPAEGRLVRTWIALLRGRTRASLAATTGVETTADVVKYLLAGADTVMTASALLHHGPAYAGTLLDGLVDWIGRKGFSSIAEFRGLSAAPRDTDAAAQQRSGYVSVLQTARRTYNPR